MKYSFAKSVSKESEVAMDKALLEVRRAWNANRKNVGLHRRYIRALNQRGLHLFRVKRMYFQEFEQDGLLIEEYSFKMIIFVEAESQFHLKLEELEDKDFTIIYESAHYTRKDRVANKVNYKDIPLTKELRDAWIDDPSSQIDLDAYKFRLQQEKRHLFEVYFETVHVDYTNIDTGAQTYGGQEGESYHYTMFCALAELPCSDGKEIDFSKMAEESLQQWVNKNKGLFKEFDSNDALEPKANYIEITNAGLPPPPEAREAYYT